MTSLGTTLLKKLEYNGCKGIIVPIRRLYNLQQEMIALYQSGLLNNELIHKYLNRFQYDYSAVLPNAQSIIVAAVPQPITILRFMRQGKKHEIVIPPTYIYTEAEKLVLHIVESKFKKNFSLVRAKLPLKLLAVRNGLSQYGRNNISYIGGMGSFYRLIALVSDMPSDLDTWQNIQRMPACNNCRACLNSCPTKCIDINSNIIHATKCLTYINESSEPFPDWVNPSWHNALVGCMRCQLACPQNKNYTSIKNFEDILTEAEINTLLKMNDFTNLPKATQDTLEKLNLTDYELTILQRNLRTLLLY